MESRGSSEGCGNDFWGCIAFLILIVVIGYGVVNNWEAISRVISNVASDAAGTAGRFLDGVAKPFKQPTQRPYPVYSCSYGKPIGKIENMWYTRTNAIAIKFYDLQVRLNGGTVRFIYDVPEHCLKGKKFGSVWP